MRLLSHPPSLILTLGIGLMAAACDAPDQDAVAGEICSAAEVSTALPDELAETSGIATSQAHPGVFWSQNDSGGDSAVYAIDPGGAVMARVRLRGVTNRDWEDIAVGPCPDGGSCLFVGDIGDNSERQESIAFHRIREPDPRRDTLSGAVTTLRARYPTGPRDAEAIFVTERGIHVITKGRSGPIELFRLAPPFDPERTATLELVQRLAPPPTSVSAQVTAAAVNPPRNRVVVRSYAGLRFFEIAGDTLRPIGRTADLVAPDQLQGEGVDWVDTERFVLTGEAQGQQPPRFAIVRCDPSRPQGDSAATAAATRTS